MNNSIIRKAAVLAAVGFGLLGSSVQVEGAQFWLRAGATTNTMPDGVKVVMWGFAKDSGANVSDGTITVPGPQLDVPPGDTSLVIHLRNTLPEPVSIVIPGQYGLPSGGLAPAYHGNTSVYSGRVRSLTKETAPGTSVNYTWQNVQPGTFLYHSGTHPSVQVQMGLYGAVTAVSSAHVAYAGQPFDSAATILFSEIDPEVHSAVASGSFGPGPGFSAGELPNATAVFNAIQASADPVAVWLAAQLTTAGALVDDLNAILEVPGSIYDPTLFPDEILSDVTLDLLWQFPKIDQPTSTLPFNPKMVRLNRLLLQDGLANAGITLPAVKRMTSTIRSYAQYFLVNGKAYPSGNTHDNPLRVGAPGSKVLLRFLNAGMDAHVPTLNNGGDLQLIAEDGQLSPYPRSTAAFFLPALKTVDALWTPAPEGVFAVYDRRLGLVNAMQSPGGMITFLKVAVSVAPQIVSQPASQTVPDFGNASFTVSATGDGLTYQWQRFTGGIWVNITGATDPTYTLAGARYATDNGALFRVIVTGTEAPAATSDTATLTVTPVGPQIVTQPIDVNVIAGHPASFSVVARATGPLTYRWWHQNPTTLVWAALPIGGGQFSGVTSATLNILVPGTSLPVNAGKYRVVVTSTGPGAGTITSAEATLGIQFVAPTITTQPTSITTTANPSGGVSFSSAATGSPAPTYQWQRWNGSAWVAIGGATTPTYSINSLGTTVAAAGKYRMVATNPAGSATSAEATLTVTQTFVRTATIQIPTIIVAPGAPATGASLYPSASPSVPTVTGASVQGASLTLTSLYHPRLSDVNVLLVPPGSSTGLGVMLGAGGAAAIPQAPTVGHINLTFSDAGASPVAGATGTYAPSNLSPSYSFPAGATVTPPANPPVYLGHFSDLNGINPSGAWSLFITDSQSGPTTGGGGAIPGGISGWSLTLTVGP